MADVKEVVGRTVTRSLSQEEWENVEAWANVQGYDMVTAMDRLFTVGLAALWLGMAGEGN